MTASINYMVPQSGPTALWRIFATFSHLKVTMVNVQHRKIDIKNLLGSEILTFKGFFIWLKYMTASINLMVPQRGPTALWRFFDTISHFLANTVNLELSRIDIKTSYI